MRSTKFRFHLGHGLLEDGVTLVGCDLPQGLQYKVPQVHPGVRDHQVIRFQNFVIIEQDDFLNACLLLKTLLSPEELLVRLHEIEQAAHRERIIHWGPRTLDLDILLYDDLILETEELVIPHPEMHLRDFVLKPLREIAPNKRHPILQKTVAQMENELG